MSDELSVTREGECAPVPGMTLYLAKWSTRFWAWLILLINFLWDYLHWDPFELGFWSLFFFLYWMISDGYKGQSFGKMVMNIKVVKRDGTKIKYGSAAIESLGKAILLPIDCLIGWFGMPGTKLRLFNRISNTIVIKTDYREPNGIIYIKEKE
jgi:uncharacterized RDD family membrane protein YckC